MSAVFDSQFLDMRAAFARDGIDIQVAYTPAGEDDYLYVAGRLLAVDDPGTVRRLGEVLPGIRRAGQHEQPSAGGLVVLSIDELEQGYLTVPESLDIIDERLGEESPARRGGVPVVTPVHVMHITARLCQAAEPEVPCCCQAGRAGDEPVRPCPPPVEDGGEGVRIGVCDTGLLQHPDVTRPWPWLAGVTGDPDPPGVILSGGARDIPKYHGHGTFAAGVARCEAPRSAVYVADHFTKSGGELEHVIIDKLEQLIADQSPDVVNLSAGGYTRNNWAPLSFSLFHERYGDITLTAAAGNDATDRKFWPAAFPWAVSVGALGADGRHRAWFSNYGDWVDVYAPGEGLVNAFAVGVYTYREPPRRPAKQDFDGMARWSGTSFSAPLVAGLIAARMSGTSAPAAAAAQAVLAQAQAVPGVGPALFPR